MEEYEEIENDAPHAFDVHHRRASSRASSRASGNANRAPIRSEIRKKLVSWSAQSNKWEQSETVGEQARHACDHQSG